MEEKIKKFLDSLSREQLEAVSLDALTELINRDIVRFNPDNSSMIFPYWEGLTFNTKFKFYLQPGDIFNRLTVLEKLPKVKGKKRKFKCLCVCGKIKNVRKDHLIKGNTQSCGCLKKELISNRNTTHGLSKKDGNYTRLYSCWLAIKARCYNSNSPNFKWYGGKGIKMDKSWREDYFKFQEWAYTNGYYCQEEGTLYKNRLSIDRINNQGNYTPDNCQWITVSENSKKANFYRQGDAVGGLKD